MSSLLLIPAAGTGSRLRASVPKVLVPIAGRPMLDYLLDLYCDVVDRVVVIVSPGAVDLVTRHVAGRQDVEIAVQPEPTGMLDAILLASTAVERQSPLTVWVTWCDQVAVHPRTIARLRELTGLHPDAAIVMPTVYQREPYIHLQRDHNGRITRVLHRREGDAMPAEGEGDMGLFALSARAYRELLPQYAREAEVGGATGERNFLPFIPWAARRADVVTFASTAPEEAIGINTPEELERVAKYLEGRQP